MNARTVALLLALAAPYALAQDPPQPPAPDNACQAKYAEIGLPEYKSADQEGVLLCREVFVLSHNGDRLTPDWVLERLNPTYFKGEGDRKKHCRFKADETLKELGLPGAADADYKGGDYDRGHMAPAADNKVSEAATRESCFLSNIAPQVGQGLNRDVWADLEDLVRNWTCDRSDLVVITGPIYDGPRPKKIGDNKVAVPTAFYKIVYEPERKRALSFILDNRAVDRKGKASVDVLAQRFRRNVNEIEARTGLRFFTALSLRDQKRLRSTTSPMWSVLEGCPRAPGKKKRKD